MSIIRDFYSTADIIDMFHITKMTLYRWRKENKIPYVRVGPKKILYEKRAIDAFIASRENEVKE